MLENLFHVFLVCIVGDFVELYACVFCSDDWACSAEVQWRSAKCSAFAC